MSVEPVELRVVAPATRVSFPTPRPLGVFDDAPAFDLRERVAGVADLELLSYLTWRAEDPIAHDTQSGRDRDEGIAWANRAVAAARGVS